MVSLIVDHPPVLNFGFRISNFEFFTHPPCAGETRAPQGEMILQAIITSYETKIELLERGLQQQPLNDKNHEQEYHR